MHLQGKRYSSCIVSPGAEFKLTILLVKRIIIHSYLTAAFNDCGHVQADHTLVCDDSFCSCHAVAKAFSSTEK